MSLLKTSHQLMNSVTVCTRSTRIHYSQRLIHISSKLNSNQSETHESVPRKEDAKLYPTHIPTTLFQKSLLTIGSALTSILDPYRHDMVAVLGEVTGHFALQRVLQIMESDEEGRQILRDRPHISSSTVDLKYLETLSPDTLGGVYSKFLKDNNVTPDTRMPVYFVDDPKLAFVMQRYREVHDLLHAVLGMPTNMLGEVVIKWVEAIQTGLPMCYMGAIMGPVRFTQKQRNRYVETHLPWAIRCGQNCKMLINVYYEERWEQNYAEMCRELNIPPPPQ